MAGRDAAADWLALNRANWDERVPLHRAVAYGGGDHATRSGFLHATEAAELGAVAGLRLLHLQCHFGHDSLTLASMGAEVTGVDFSLPAIEAARADSVGFGIPARFVHANLYDAPEVLAEPEGFDRVFTSWGTVCWLPDIVGWARVVAHFLRPGGKFYFVDMHPVAYVLDDRAGDGGRPGWFDPYLGGQPLVLDDPTDYADPEARLANQRQVSFLHPVSAIVMALIDAGLRLDFLHEHPTVEWQAFRCLVQDERGSWGWPDRPWFPLSLSLGATRVG